MNVRLWIKDCFEMRVSVPSEKFQQSVGAISCKHFKHDKVKRSRREELPGLQNQPAYVPQLKETPTKIFNITFNFAVGSR